MGAYCESERGDDENPDSSNNKQLIEGITNRDDTQVTAALEAGANARLKWGRHSRSAFTHAMCQPSASAAIVQALYAANADIGTRDSAGWTVCHWIAQAGHRGNTSNKLWAMLTKLKPKGATGESSSRLHSAANDREGFGLTPLHIACLEAVDAADGTQPTRDFIKRMLELVDPVAAVRPLEGACGTMANRFKGWTPLCFAAACGSLEATDALLQDGRVQSAEALEAEAHEDSTAAHGVVPKTAFMIVVRNMLRTREQLSGKLKQLENDEWIFSPLGIPQTTDQLPAAKAKKVLTAIIDMYSSLNCLQLLQPQIASLRKEMESFNQCAEAVQVGKEIEMYYQQALKGGNAPSQNVSYHTNQEGQAPTDKDVGSGCCM